MLFRSGAARLMHIGDFDFYQEFLLKRMGLSLTADKSYLLDSRLTPVSKKWNFPNLEMMTMSMRGMPDPRLVQDVIEAMADHDTCFFMDNRSFSFFEKTALPAIMKNRRAKHLRFWCAACSSGQEPYSLAMLRSLHPPGPDLHGRVAYHRGSSALSSFSR